LPVQEPPPVNKFTLPVYTFEAATNGRTAPLRYEFAWLTSDCRNGDRENSMMARWLQMYIGLSC